MAAAQWIGLMGGVVVALAVRLSNVIVAGLAKIFGVENPDPIPDPTEGED